MTASDIDSNNELKLPYILENISAFNTLTENIYNGPDFPLHGIDGPKLRCHKAQPKSTAIKKVATISRSKLNKWSTTILCISRSTLANRLRGNARRYKPTTLMSLPTELLIEIMSHCSPISIYCLRQTSSVFMGIFDISRFSYWHQDATTDIGNYKQFDIDKLNRATAVNDIATLIPYEGYCRSCKAAKESRLIAARLAFLQGFRYCFGCDRFHVSALFTSRDLAIYNDEGPIQILCIGRKGYISPCSYHPNKRIKWENTHTPSFKIYGSACTDRSHQPKHEDNNNNNMLFRSVGSAFPRFSASRNFVDLKRDIAYGWDLPILQFDSLSKAPLDSIHKKLETTIQRGLRNQRLCSHISAGKQMEAFIRSSICQCFITRGVCHIDQAFDDCKCGRQVTLSCQVCDETYFWLLHNNRIILSMRYMCSVERPTSIGWMNLINKEYIQKHVYTEENKHVLWCNVSSCRTNTRGRWERLVKENTTSHPLDFSIYFEDYSSSGFS